MDTKEALNVLEMFLYKVCSLARTEFAYDQNTVWQAVKKATDALEANQWIPMSKRPPEIGQYVLISIRSLMDMNYIATATFKGDYWESTFDLDWEEVLAWMPTPKPYKVEDK